jgi:hypothetical protein
MQKLIFMIVPLLLTAVAMLAACSQQTAENIRLQDTATKIQKILQAELNTLDADMAGAARQIAVTGLTGDEAEKILLGLCKNRPYVVDCSTVGPGGKLVTVMPEEYSSFQGSDVSGQEQVVKLFQTKQPVLSHIFKAVEGFMAVDLEHPVISGKGELMGAVSALVKTEVLFDKLARPELNGTGFENVWAMQKDGWIIYDYHPSEINTNLFTDASYQPYKELLTLGKQISERESGCGGYRYLSPGTTEPIKKQVCWSSLSLHGTQWRIIVARVSGK